MPSRESSPGRRGRVLAALAVLCAAPGVAAQDDGLGTIVITAPRVQRDVMDTPAAVDRVRAREIRQGRKGIQLDESLNQVPGLFFQNQYNFAQGLRVSTRGFGARAPFGVRGIRIRVDGFPETLPDGQAQTDAIDLDSAERIEVIRGPSSALYGNAAGGVIDITTADGRDMPYSPVVSFDAGSHGYRKLGARAGGTADDWAYHASLSALESDGYRDHSRVEKQLFNAKLTRRLDGRRELQAVFTAMDNPLAEDPGGLSAAGVREDRRQADPDAAPLDAGQEVDQQRLGLTYRDGDFGGGALTLRGFYTRRDFIQRLPFFFTVSGSPAADNVPAYERDFYGVGVEYAGDDHVGATPFRYLAGIDVDRQVDARERFGTDADGNIVDKYQDERQQATTIGPFLQGDLDLTERLDLSAGVRFDRVRFEIDDRFLADGDQSGRRTFEEWSGTLGALYTLAPGHRAYVNVGTAFQTPTFTEFADPSGGGGFNPDIEPQQALNRELGLRGRAGSRVRYDLALYAVRVRDEIIPFAESGDRTFYENAGLTRREGLELGLDWIATDTLTLAAAYTYSNARFARFTDIDGNRFGGNRMPGIPEHHLYVEGDWQTAGGRYATLSTRYVGSVYADNANDVEVDGYTVVDARIGRRLGLGDDRRLEMFLGVDNVLDEQYIANVRVNMGPGFFEPAPGRTWIAGIELGF
ncbi:MAG: TonB-dependent receptor [Halofilum sp. (in: g-proteobacteria)]|nr:TonB-dependent receptor [Halofilum sp. (in: g-proteobacteria)]